MMKNSCKDQIMNEKLQQERKTIFDVAEVRGGNQVTGNEH